MLRTLERLRAARRDQNGFTLIESPDRHHHPGHPRRDRRLLGPRHHQPGRHGCLQGERQVGADRGRGVLRPGEPVPDGDRPDHHAGAHRDAAESTVLLQEAPPAGIITFGATSSDEPTYKSLASC
ncbi:hypothetical protein G5V59_08110 [Nocardioides sp. W3-2-3]|uniref:hypothetical protein n=1 Tax=Nocardioides convexus TaxID=2712224 RepID=UPI0024189936|nr:hypothetical protein [Nocardioides convexus]NHA00133.1 hypothetical protein [Nocardioides convexus]